MMHTLKIDKNYLENLVSGRKKAEVRINDRDYQLGDTLHFHDYNFEGTDYYFKITHIHSGLGLERNYVMLSVEPTEAK